MIKIGTFLKLLTLVLFLFNEIGALYGGWNLMIHPDGSSIQLSQDWLKHTPFDDYLIPGIVLFTVNGLLSMVVAGAVLVRSPHQAALVITQGLILSGWIIIQILLIRTIYFLHFILGGIGLALIVLGFFSSEIKNQKEEQVNQ